MLTSWHIEPGRELAMLLAQIGHESNNLTRWEENLNYSTAERIAAVFGKRRFPTVDAAKPYVNQPEKLANFVYAGMIGNGLVAAGDGWRFRGRSPVQLTGRANYRACAAKIGHPLETSPELALQPDVGMQCVGWFWSSKGCAEPARSGDVRTVTHLINGGEVGLPDRIARYERACRVLGLQP